MPKTLNKTYKLKSKNQSKKTVTRDENILSKIKEIKKRFFETVEKEVKEINVIHFDERVSSVAIVVIFPLIILYFVAHQMWSTGFFTTTFSTLEMLLFYGSLIPWIITGALYGIGQKNPSRDFDAFGGILFVPIALTWIYVVFPFDFTYFANVLPLFLRFLVQWISNDIARIIIIIIIIINLVVAVYATILRVSVRKELSKRKK
ncbi:hypothetical protein ES705_36242 [subsurface metagenome]